MVVSPRQQKGTTVKVIKVVLKRNVFIGGKPFKPGDEVDLPEGEAKYLVNIKKAEFKDAPKDTETTESKQAKTREKR